MGESQVVNQLNISFEDEVNMANNSKYKRWIEIGFNAVLILVCLSAATLLGELYYREGGKSTWMNSLVQMVGFPILFPILLLKKREEKHMHKNTINSNNKNPSVWMFLSVYVFLGILLGGSCMLNAVGLLHLPVSTFSLISASQLGFNALFSFFLNSQKITTYIANSIILLTISSILLVFQPDDSSSTDSSKGKGYVLIGFICTLFGSAGYALLLSATERIFRNIMKKRTLKEVMSVVIWQSFFATCAILIGLFASGEWRWIKTEMNEYKLGEVSYVMTLVWNALAWQIYTIGLLSLIIKVSALFANVITTLSVPLIPLLALIFFNEKISGVKVISMILAIWGFLSYGYQQYLDEVNLKTELSKAKEEAQLSLVETGLNHRAS
ncbi:hypothetical protein RDI58_004985 [Solanum bulbocastanum]|uniref:Probable purine permease n=1 Tax=Solanum bulbocastanum TaxID=147425 RepID=A0AAN8TYL5_SOLBU